MTLIDQLEARMRARAATGSTLHDEWQIMLSEVRAFIADLQSEEVVEEGAMEINIKAFGTHPMTLPVNENDRKYARAAIAVIVRRLG